jgi:CheY-like chemotaxis protein
VPAQPLWVNADPTRIEQVVANLLNNAIKYTEPGGQVRVTLEREGGGEALIRVRDTGAGIPADMLPRVFEVFTQMDQTLDRSQGGLGIGLSLVRSLVELHGGAVTAHSDGEGKGAEFVVRLPVLKGEGVRAGGRMPDEGGRTPGVQASSLRRQPAARRVLVVDDNRDAAESLAELLELWGSTVQVAFNGTEALSAAAGFRPEVVLLDIGLPDTDGYEVARRLRQRKDLHGVLLAAVTGYGQAEDRQRAREAGFDLHLTKPVDPELLRDLLHSERAA